MNEIENYQLNVGEKWQPAFQRLLSVTEENMPSGFELVLQYGMPTFVVPLSMYPEGYLSRIGEPLPFISIAAQKRHLSFYHMGLMGNKQLLNWFEEEYRKEMPTKLNMGKSCIRFSNPEKIPYELMGKLVQKITPEEWVEQYEHFRKKNN